MENKAEFVEKYLKPLLIAANVEVIDAVYEKQEGEEIVRITFWGGGTHEKNVSCDSLIALSRDVLKGL